MNYSAETACRLATRAQNTAEFARYALSPQRIREWTLASPLRSITRTALNAICMALCACASWTSVARAQSAQDQPKPDNTRVNKRDRNPGEATADQQKADRGDRDLTSKIRKAIVDDKSLSTYGHNVKVISQNGVVTLKGPVRSEAEAKSIVEKAP